MRQHPESFTPSLQQHTLLNAWGFKYMLVASQKEREDP